MEKDFSREVKDHSVNIKVHCVSNEKRIGPALMVVYEKGDILGFVIAVLNMHGQLLNAIKREIINEDAMIGKAITVFDERNCLGRMLSGDTFLIEYVSV